MAKKRQPSQKKPKQKNNPFKSQSPSELWGNKWGTLKFISTFLGLIVMFFTVRGHSQLESSGQLTSAVIVMPLLLSVVLVFVGLFFLFAPISPFQLYGKPKHRWLFGWVYFMALISYVIGHFIGYFIYAGILS